MKKKSEDLKNFRKFQNLWKILSENIFISISKQFYKIIQKIKKISKKSIKCHRKYDLKKIFKIPTINNNYYTN
jgi:hypothetical protein